MASIFKNEVILSRNSFHKQELWNDKLGIAQVIQNILFTEKGTYPNQPELGIGIENYLFEKVDKGTLTGLEDEIKYQVEKFCPNEYIVKPFVESRLVNGNPTLCISFTIYDVEKRVETQFAVVVGKSKNTKNMISRLIT